MLRGIHHIAIICSNYDVSKHFYTQVLGLTILAETYRQDRQSHKLDLGLDGRYVIELFSFPSPPERVSRPEACGLRHLAFAVDSIVEMQQHLASHAILMEPVRVDELTGKAFFFIADPDGLPIEFYELG